MSSNFYRQNEAATKIILAYRDVERVCRQCWCRCVPNRHLGGADPHGTLILPIARSLECVRPGSSTRRELRGGLGSPDKANCRRSMPSASSRRCSEIGRAPV